MIRSYLIKNNTLSAIDLTEHQGSFSESLWIDLLNPTEQEARQVAGMLNIALPTREEMHEIELSSRLYQENGALYMTAILVTGGDTDEPSNDAFTFILKNDHLITVRYADPQPFRLLTHRREPFPTPYSGKSLLIALLEIIIDRIADVLERAGKSIDMLTKRIFRRSKNPKKLIAALDKGTFQDILDGIGVNGDLVSKTRESLVSISRLISFLSQVLGIRGLNELEMRIITLSKDVSDLSDHANFLANKANFLLDATLGMISIEQNNIVKIFSVAAVVFLPPTLIASIYGMNFDIIPELKWTAGYPFALALMALSAYLPYRFFKARGWL